MLAKRKWLITKIHSIVKNILIFILIVTINSLSHLEAQYIAEENELINETFKLPSTLLIPENIKKPPVVLIIAGSGPTNKDGNNFFMVNNHLKFLAEALADQGIASLRFDKRSIPGNNSIKEEDLRFEDLISDASFSLNSIRKDKRFGKTFILGHSQGSLVGMKVAQENKVNGYISIAGPSEAIGNTIIRQITTQNEKLGEQTAILIDSMLAGYEVKNINPLLLSLFRPTVQPFLRTYMSYNPIEEIKKLKTKILIIQGTTDIQVEEKDAEKLHAAVPKSQLKMIEGMNHILKEAPIAMTENMKTYNDADLPVMDELMNAIITFIK